MREQTRGTGGDGANSRGMTVIWAAASIGKNQHLAKMDEGWRQKVMEIY